MSVYRESGFEFDFSSARSSTIHDKAEPHDGNTFWPGVDFRIVEPEEDVWIEVKSWSYDLIRDRSERWRAARDWNERVGTDLLRDETVGKFFGTTAYLAWSERGLPPRVRYVVFLQPPTRKDRGLLGPFRERLRDEFKNAQAREWGRRIRFEVVDLELFRSLFPNYKVSHP